MKKVISILLTIALVLSLGVVASFADEPVVTTGAEERENIALERYVESWNETGTASTLEMPEWFSIVNLVDGRLDEFDGDTSNLEQSLAWYTANDTRDTEIAGVVELDKTYRIGEVKVFPSKFLNGMSMPTTFNVEISMDGDEWVKIGGEEKLKDNVVYSDPFIYDGNGQSANFVRILILKASAISDGKFYAGIGELEVYEYVEPPLNVVDFNADTQKMSFDRILINDKAVAEGNSEVTALKANVDGEEKNAESVTLYGFFGMADESVKFDEVFSSFGYILDDEKPVFDASFAVKDALDSGLIYQVKVDVSGLTDGQTHTIKACAKMANNDLVILNKSGEEAQITYKAKFVATPEPTEEPTNEPAATEEPTEAEAPTEEPKKTEEKKGCGGILGGTIALAAAAACVLVIRKKH